MSAITNRWALAPLAFTAVLVSCAMPAHRTEIRQVNRGALAQNGAPSLDRGREMYARGEYGLAIEAFRRAVREAPEDPSGYNGLAACYDMIGRFDLSRRNYELALAVAPGDARIYRNMARSMEMQGDRDAAVALRAEAVRVAAGSDDGPVVTESSKVADVEAPKQGAIANVAAAPVALPPVFETPVAPEPQRVVAPRAAPKLAVPQFAIAVPKVEPVTARETTLKMRDGYQIAVSLETETGSGSVVAVKPPAIARVALAPPAIKLAVPARKTVVGARVSIPLAPLARAQTVQSQPQRQAIRIMNAGGVRGLAKRTQDRLTALGWKKSDVGDSDRRFAKSWVVYPASEYRRAMALKRQLPFATRAIVDSRATRVVLLLGENAASYEARRSAKVRHG
jgi:LytR cell envelope-related transcriptional attenuator